MSRSGPAWVSGNTLVDDDGQPLDEVAMGRDLRIPGVIRTGAGPTTTTFGGFETEDFSVLAGGMHISTGTPTLVVTSGFPRWQFADAATSGVVTGFWNCPVWYKNIDVHFAVVNDHSGTGNVRLRTIVRECDVGQALSAAGTIHDVTATYAAPAANGGLGIVVSVASVAFTPGFFGSVYTCEIQRLGADGADTLAGPLSVGAAGFTRVTP